MQLTEAALPGAVSSLHVHSCLLGASRASCMDRQWHEPRCLPGVSDVAVAVGLRTWEQSVGVEQAFWRGMLCSITIFLLQGSKWQGGCGDLLPACQSLVASSPVGWQSWVSWEGTAGLPCAFGALISRSLGSPGPTENIGHSPPPSFFKDENILKTENCLQHGCVPWGWLLV